MALFDKRDQERQAVHQAQCVYMTEMKQ